MTRILFVDDDLDLLQGLCRAFREEPWQLIVASDAEAALLLLGTRPFDVVIADMHMPGLDGATLLEKVRRESPGTVRILLTGAADQHTLDRGVMVSDAVVGKSCAVQTLREMIEELLTRSLASARPFFV